MTRTSPQRRTQEQIRAGNLRLGMILFAIVMLFFVGIFVKRAWFA